MFPNHEVTPHFVRLEFNCQRVTVENEHRLLVNSIHKTSDLGVSIAVNLSWL